MHYAPSLARKSHVAFALLVIAVFLAACETPQGDSFGPPAGWARIRGTVRHADQRPAPHRTVYVACDGEGFLEGHGSDASNERGEYAIWVSLPPVGIFHEPPGDVTLSCRVAVAVADGDRQQIELTFTGRKEDAEVHTVDLEVVP